MANCCDKKQSKRIKEWGTNKETSNTKGKLKQLLENIIKTNKTK
jgi:hypothetical protein